jgi:hypothetical protein
MITKIKGRAKRAARWNGIVQDCKGLGIYTRQIQALRELGYKGSVALVD